MVSEVTELRFSQCSEMQLVVTRLFIFYEIWRLESIDFCHLHTVKASSIMRKKVKVNNLLSENGLDDLEVITYPI